jgi:uncharacterized protein YbjT (DUF2867 family)/uncharacterized membrane protein YphA (DoxX/SURF4 family)
MRVLVTGAYGFIGAHITAALTESGHEVVCAVRGARLDTRFPGLQAIACDMARDLSTDDWRPRLVNIDAVVNCAGILRETPGQTFEMVHEKAPGALFQACAELGIRRVIQISALGDTADGEFIASKHRGDNALASMDLDWLIFRPSLVYSTRGSYGGTSLLRGLCALPWVLPLPGQGDQNVQPICAEDVGRAVSSALAIPSCKQQILELVGPQVMPLRDYLMHWRRWLGFAAPRQVNMPAWMVRLAATCGERFGSGPLGLTMMRMLERGNIGSRVALQVLHSKLELSPKPLARALDESPSHVQDRWHARQYFLLPTLRIVVALLWLASGIIGWVTPENEIAKSTPGHDIPLGALVALARCTATSDFVLGALCLLGWRSGWVLSLMLVMLLGYTVGIGVLWPVHWLDPFGGLLKNLPLIVALLILIVTDERR